jgi:EAL domain-containing protein (putative c-di-GMP-specific phosphodiesterase class I)
MQPLIRDNRLKCLSVNLYARHLRYALNPAVVTEGVETESQALRLTACGCSVLQKYLFGRPMPPHALMQVLEAPSNLVLGRAD